MAEDLLITCSLVHNDPTAVPFKISVRLDPPKVYGDGSTLGYDITFGHALTTYIRLHNTPAFVLEVLSMLQWTGFVESHLGQHGFC